MSVLGTVFIALAAAVVAFVIGVFVGISSDPVCQVSTEPNPVKTFNAPLKPNEDVREPVVMSKAVLPKRIKELEYNMRVNAALQEVIDKAVDVWVSGHSKAYKRQIANNLYHEWHVKIENANYHDYNPELQCLNFVGRRVGSGFKFVAFWTEKAPTVQK